MSTPDDRLRHALASLPQPRHRNAFLLGLFVCMTIGLVCFVWRLGGANPPARDGLLLVGAVGGLVGALAFGIALGVHLHRIRDQQRALVAAALGLELVPKVPRELRHTVFAPFAALPMLRTGGKGIRYHMSGEHAGEWIDLVEHVYVVSTGKSSHVVVHTAAATPCPPGWPALSLTPRSGLAKLWEAIVGEDLQVESRVFNDRWTIRTASNDFAILFLSPEVQDFLSHAGVHETWHVSAGSLCWVARTRLSPAELAAAVARQATLRAMVPPELDEWGP